MQLPIEDRRRAGLALAGSLQSLTGRSDTLVLALPRGGVPVAYEIARTLRAPLDLMLIRKLGVPGHAELAMGAIAIGGFRLLNQDVVHSLSIPDVTIEQVEQRERHELERRLRVYRGNKPLPELHDRCLILVDDGVATGATMRVAIASARQQKPRLILVAVPLAPKDIASLLRREADRLVCLATPEPFISIGCWYRDFHQVSDEEVSALLSMSQQDLG
ncbi:phosphoribosyltransferase [Photobacterium halotolerans]|uniref:phosphoribosyltransferase n=1 Tax=Photobacterium halotolerans TaxID=265726 RepID=UPI0013723ED1|nr:phosphoribosyltransferase [Photobacterium halotolerans]NAX49425.1 phosphoribosyltransferase [Photobacterium halotolerans]